MTAVLAVLAATLAVAAPAAEAAIHPDPYRCGRTYTRAHFHAAARSTYRTAFPPARKIRTLNRIVRCQRRRASIRIVRMHRARYRAAWRARFYFDHVWAAVPYGYKAHLAAIRACESGGNYATNTGNGFYGAYQFTLGTWGVVGGSGNPAAASPREQDVRAYWLLSRYGAGHWPVCG